MPTAAPVAAPAAAPASALFKSFIAQPLAEPSHYWEVPEAVAQTPQGPMDLLKDDSAATPIAESPIAATPSAATPSAATPSQYQWAPQDGFLPRHHHQWTMPEIGIGLEHPPNEGPYQTQVLSTMQLCLVRRAVISI